MKKIKKSLVNLIVHKMETITQLKHNVQIFKEDEQNYLCLIDLVFFCCHRKFLPQTIIMAVNFSTLIIV